MGFIEPVKVLGTQREPLANANNTGTQVEKTDRDTDEHVSKHTDAHTLEIDDIHSGQDVVYSCSGANSKAHYFHPQQNVC